MHDSRWVGWLRGYGMMESGYIALLNVGGLVVWVWNDGTRPHWTTYGGLVGCEGME